ncbi:MAG: 30S ribosomal protein S12 methylthiotransferase RimO [Deltaproteobacteria bacterium]|nr:30S ribosomal protein S12 methylthiotransferase RimO [Deltaproteobacteria bacterium]
MSKTIHFVSLGCPKNTVDTERMVALAESQGFRVCREPQEADVIVVNTCGFIEPAKQESIDTLLQMAEHKEGGRCKQLVMAGCLSQRYPDVLSRELPEVDHFIGTADLPRLGRIFDKSGESRIAVGEPKGLDEADYRRTLIGPPHSAYLKISEGCNRPCAFCSIPIMRGRQRSRTIASLVDEAHALAAQGTRELILVAQDSTAYGSDLPRGEARLELLLQALKEVELLRWIRVHYAYPSMLTPPLLEAMAELPQVVPYIDIPIQHVDDGLLKIMKRGYSGDGVRKTIHELRAAIPEMWIRTTLLVGHPGETHDAHLRLMDFLTEEKIDHVGTFVFSPEESTPAAELPDTVPDNLAEERRDEVMTLQRDIAREKLERLRGRTIEVMIDGVSEESEFLLQGRHAGQSPGIDGNVIVADAEAQPGEIIHALVTDSAEYDLVAHQTPGAEHAEGVNP